MRLLDRYIIIEYLKIFLVITFSFSVLFLIIDVSDRLPRLMRRGAEWNDLALYFLLRIPYLVVLSSPVMVLLSGLFLMNNLAKHSESVAIRAAGISIARMVSPLFVFGLIFTIFIMLFAEFVLPKAEEYRQYIYKEKIKNQKVENKMARSHIHYLGNDKNLYYIGYFDGYREQLTTIDITTFDNENGKIDRKITASKAFWKDDEWHFEKCYIRNFDGGRLRKSEFFESTVISEVDVTPIDFIKSAKKPMSMNYFELEDYIERLKKVGEKFTKELVELNLKVSFPFANLIILLFSVPLVSTSSRSKGKGLIFAFGLLICFLYLSALRICQSLGYNDILSPIMAAWLPNVIFGTLGIFFVIKAEV
ncbi:MAG: LPS export ABC transporter permease LptG [Candidatus Cloacimonetes bacterium]|nr:LPS export ABC transporter permease LptG [Candidatus Cloacimonadota bacterium]